MKWYYIAGAIGLYFALNTKKLGSVLGSVGTVERYVVQNGKCWDSQAKKWVSDVLCRQQGLTDADKEKVSSIIRERELEGYVRA